MASSLHQYRPGPILGHMIFRPGTFRVLAMTLVMAFGVIAEAKQLLLYRYNNSQGIMVVDYQVPVEYVRNGYEVINTEGIVIKVVPRALTEEERQTKNAEEKREIEAKAEQERLRLWDESLMLRYSTVADIEAAKERALRDLQIRMSILKGNRRSLKQKVENYQAQASDWERGGKTVDVERLREIESLQEEIGAIDRAIADRQVEIEELAGTFQLDIERFEMLLEVVELRKTLRLERARKP
jgi:hypothetical protein